MSIIRFGEVVLCCPGVTRQTDCMLPIQLDLYSETTLEVKRKADDGRQGRKSVKRLDAARAPTVSIKHQHSTHRGPQFHLVTNPRMHS